MRRFVYEYARIPLYRLRLGGMWEMRMWPRWFNTVDDHALLPIVQEPEDILVIVAGGVGKHSAFGPTVGITRAVSRRIREAGDGFGRGSLLRWPRHRPGCKHAHHQG